MGTESKRTVPFDPYSESIVEHIVTSVAAIKNEEPTQLSPLADYVDPDALERLVGSAWERGPSGGFLTFEYVDVTITVNFDGNTQFEFQ